MGRDRWEAHLWEELEDLLLGWTWGVRGRKDPSVSQQSSWLEGRAVNQAGQDQSRKGVGGENGVVFQMYKG